MLDILEVVDLIKSGVSQRIKDAREYSERLNMHVTGKEVESYMDNFNYYESDQQKAVRKKLLKSNKGLFSFLLRPLDKVFTAKGGVVSYNLPERQLTTLKSFISDVSGGLNIKSYLKKKVKLQYVIDPNGFVMVDIDREGNLDTKVFSSSEVIWYKSRGNQIQAVIFNGYRSNDENDDKEYFRVVDSKTDSIFIKDGDIVYQDETSIIENTLGFVPAYILGDIHDPNSNLFLSVIDEVIEDAAEHLRDVSVNTVHKLSHGYAKYWQYPEMCNTCGGDGKIQYNDSEGNLAEKVCHTCNGTGVKNRKDASDLMLIPIPDEESAKIAPEVGGYINPSIEIWRQYNEDIAGITTVMFQRMWGSTYQNDTENETATGRLLNVQPEAERVTGISQTFSNIHEFILDTYGKIVISDSYKSEVSYGTRYLMESPDELLKRYQESKEKNLPPVLQIDLLDRFYQTEFANNNIEYRKRTKILSVDPFPAMSAKEVKDLGVDEIDLKMKIYYPQWVNQLDEPKKQLMTEQELREDLKNYVESKTITNEV